MFWYYISFSCSLFYSCNALRLTRELVKLLFTCYCCSNGNQVTPTNPGASNLLKNILNNSHLLTFYHANIVWIQPTWLAFSSSRISVYNLLTWPWVSCLFLGHKERQLIKRESTEKPQGAGVKNHLARKTGNGSEKRHE